MRCPVCDSKTDCQTGKHQYVESGLDNIIISGVEICICSCGEEIVSVPAVPELHSLIGLYLVKKKALLIGKEIRFLRKNIGLTAKKLSGYLGVDNATISRWEKGNQAINKANDRFLRLVYCNIKGISQEEIKHLIEEEFSGIKPRQEKVPNYIIPIDKWSNLENACTPLR